MVAVVDKGVGGDSPSGIFDAQGEISARRAPASGFEKATRKYGRSADR